MSDITTPEKAEFDKEFVQHPHDVLRRGPARPVVLPNGWPGWLVTSYEETRRLLADSRVRKDVVEVRKLFPPGLARGYASSLTETMLGTDPPDHTRLRRTAVSSPGRPTPSASAGSRSASPPTARCCPPPPRLAWARPAAT
jgi:cytochrome P450